MNFCKCAASVLISLVLGAASDAQDEPYPPGTLVPMIDLELRQVPLEVPASLRSEVPEGLTLNLPQGFSVSVFAAGKLSYPRFMAFDAADVLHLADLSRGLIVALPDADGDGVADEQIVAASGFKAAHSLAFYKGDMYVAETHQVVRLHDADGDLFYEEREVFIADIPSAAWHSWKTIVFDEGKGLSTEEQRYDPTPVINELRRHVDWWRSLPNPNDWQVTPETARLLQHCRHHKFNDIRPFSCQVEAVEMHYLADGGGAEDR